MTAALRMASASVPSLERRSEGMKAEPSTQRTERGRKTASKRACDTFSASKATVRHPLSATALAT